jgi:hypothetical protein
MDTPETAGPLRWVRRTLPLALMLAIGGFAASSLNAYSVGYVLFGLAGTNLVASVVLGIVLKSRLQSYVRTLQVQQQAELDSTFRSDKW